MQWSLILLFLMAQCCFMDCQLYEFHYINENKTWTEAQQYCREKHTDLVTVTNMKDMKRLINISAEDQSEAWIGLINKPEFNRTWFWSLPGVEFDEKTNTTHKYHFIEERKSWQKAQSYCREKHTDLISGTKQVLDGEVEKLMDQPYIGLFRDTWRWSDGSSFSFRHWNLQCNDEQYISDQCAMTKFDGEGRWTNMSCDNEKPFICYDDNVILIKENKTWEDALYYCRDHHHDLVTITNMDDQRWIQEKVKEASTDYVWMGLSYACTLDLWFWVSDEVVRYKTWASNPPMDDCDMSGAMETGGEHQWFKRNDAEKFNFICSKK
ncbi:C-type mannose receptor 2-like [Poecilia reticulata]|uniref:C-type mannose receptor 2-like n=1 Tax=Poecilia reticulata TaxID=8081 RepID=UPI0004A32B8D|nr:PREDICTED: C-type mannose receptor 2-like [Poecilia reticulata]